MPDVDWAHAQQTIIRRFVSEFAPADIDGITPGSRLVEDLGYHSLALLELAFAIEDEFDLPPMDEETAQNFRTVQDVEDLVAAAVNSKRHADAR
jgi:acyl carrier protein